MTRNILLAVLIGVGIGGCQAWDVKCENGVIWRKASPGNWIAKTFNSTADIWTASRNELCQAGTAK